jgi:hypothetical protein
MYGRVLGVAMLGVGGHLVTVEAHVGRGLPALIVTGLPGAGVQDARERVRPAVEGAKLEWPLRRVVVNLAPADVRKEGPGLDLPLVMSVLAATRQIPSDRLRAFAFSGEVSLKGELLTTPGILTVAITAADVKVAAPEAEEELAVGFFGSRYERATPGERDYLRAMADAASEMALTGQGRIDDIGSVATSDVAIQLGKKPQSLSPARDALLKKGLIYSAERGLIAFTVPHFGRYLRSQA